MSSSQWKEAELVLLKVLEPSVSHAHCPRESSSLADLQPGRHLLLLWPRGGFPSLRHLSHGGDLPTSLRQRSSDCRGTQQVQPRGGSGRREQAKVPCEQGDDLGRPSQPMHRRTRIQVTDPSGETQKRPNGGSSPQQGSSTLNMIDFF